MAKLGPNLICPHEIVESPRLGSKCALGLFQTFERSHASLCGRIAVEVYRGEELVNMMDRLICALRTTLGALQQQWEDRPKGIQAGLRAIFVHPV